MLNYQVIVGKIQKLKEAVKSTLPIIILVSSSIKMAMNWMDYALVFGINLWITWKAHTI